MRKILIVGAGTFGLQLAHGLVRFDYDVTVVNGSSSEEMVNHLDGIGSGPDLVASTLGVDQEQVTVTDSRSCSRPATRSSLHQLLRRLEVS
ncbi:NAD-binding protein [Nocardiopsis dassonvillei]|uniref:NAD-binding protein n=1 Tax=Nocardiopsis dassonvillei TaxID=2014 RepID=UPI0003813032|nr:NAD-binding protein [Nocardiopsis dassonvillei]MCK9872381.1 hypothetical protein [Nocardiopsis dassonvillei]